MVYRKSNYWSAWSLSIALFLVSGCVKSFDSLVEESRLRWNNAICRNPSYVAIVQVSKIPSCGMLTQKNIWGCYDSMTGIIQVSRIVPTPKVVQVITHEMGHTFKLSSPRHLPTSTGLMYESSGSTPNRITKDDIYFICEEANCLCKNPEKSP